MTEIKNEKVQTYKDKNWGKKNLEQKWKIVHLQESISYLRLMI